MVTDRSRGRVSSIASMLMHPVVWFLLATMAIVVVAVGLWNQYHGSIDGNPAFRLTAEDIELIQPQPTWSRQRLVDLVMDTSETDLNLLDTQLVNKVATRIHTIGWVERINRIQKTSGGLELDIQYREPVAHVFYPDYPNSLPVDRNAIVMDPGSIAADSSNRLPRIHVFRPVAEGLHTWSEWPDQRIQSAARLASYLGSSWNSLGFYQIVSLQPQQHEGAAVPIRLYPKNGSIVIWGSAPGEELTGEAKANEKFAALADFVLHYGSFANSRPNVTYDLRSGKLIRIREIRTAKFEFDLPEIN